MAFVTQWTGSWDLWFPCCPLAGTPTPRETVQWKLTPSSCLGGSLGPLSSGIAPVKEAELSGAEAYPHSSPAAPRGYKALPGAGS